MKFYAYIPTVNKLEPMGTEHKLLFELKTFRGALRRCESIFKSNNFRLFSFTNFYDDKTFKEVKSRGI